MGGNAIAFPAPPDPEKSGARRDGVARPKWQAPAFLPPHPPAPSTPGGEGECLSAGDGEYQAPPCPDGRQSDGCRFSPSSPPRRRGPRAGSALSAAPSPSHHRKKRPPRRALGLSLDELARSNNLIGAAICRLTD